MARLRCPHQTRWGLTIQTAEIDCSLGAWGEAGKRSKRYNFCFMSASDSMFDSTWVGFRWRHCCGRNCSTQATVTLGIGPYSSYYQAALQYYIRRYGILL